MKKACSSSNLVPYQGRISPSHIYDLEWHDILPASKICFPARPPLPPPPSTGKRHHHPTPHSGNETSRSYSFFERGSAVNHQDAGLFYNEAPVGVVRRIPPDDAQRRRPVHLGRVRNAWLRRGRLEGYAEGKRQRPNIRES